MREDRAFEEGFFTRCTRMRWTASFPALRMRWRGFPRSLSGNEGKKRLIEGCLASCRAFEEVQRQGTSGRIWFQEANMALLLLVSEYEEISGHRRRNVSARLWRLPLIFRILSRKSRRRCLRE